MPPHVYSLGYVSGCMSPHVCGLQSCERACAWSETVDSGHVMKPEASPFCNPQSCRQADCGEGTSTTWGVSTPAESPTSSLAIHGLPPKHLLYPVFSEIVFIILNTDLPHDLF